MSTHQMLRASEILGGRSSSFDALMRNYTGTRSPKAGSSAFSRTPNCDESKWRRDEPNAN